MTSTVNESYFAEPLPDSRMRSGRRATVLDTFYAAAQFVFDKLPRRKVAAFGLGHVHNDLFASCWFTYLLVLMHKVLLFSSLESAITLLAGQMTDAVVTPLIGILSDKSKESGFSWRVPGCGVRHLDRRHLWYAIGTILVVVNFFFLFGRCVMCDITGDRFESVSNFIYFVVVASLANAGWAMVQVSHMALLPEMTEDPASRVKLNSVRYMATVLSNLFVFGLLAVLVHAGHLGLEDQFHTLAYVCIGVGSVTSVLFVMGTQDSKSQQRRQQQQQQQQQQQEMQMQSLGNGSGQPPTSSPSATDFPASPLHMGPIAVHTSKLLVSPSVLNGNHDPSDPATRAESASLPGEMGHGGAPATPSGHHHLSATPDSPMARPPSHSSPTPAWVERRSSPSPPLEDDPLELQLSALPVLFTSYRSWLQMPEFYSCGFIYMSARLIVTVSQVFLPLYVLDVLHLDTIYITILPCVLYLSSMAASVSMQWASVRLGLKSAFYIGSACTCAGLAIMLALTDSRPGCYVVYLCCVLVGLGNGAITVCATQLTSDLIGSRTNTAAFVVGTFSCTDKVANGIVLFMLQLYNDDQSTHLRLAVSVPPLVAALAATVVMLFFVDLAEWKRRHTLSTHIRLAATRRSDLELY